jgi:predicted HTH domain antitoxin
MTLVIPEDILQAAKMDEHAMLVELACHLFDKDHLSLGQAARMAGLTRTALEEELFRRQIPAYRYELDDFREDMQTLHAHKPKES